MQILVFEINNKAISIYKREFIIWLRFIYHYTIWVFIIEIVYSTVKYYVRTISTLFYTHFICVHSLKHGAFTVYSNNNNNNSKKVSTMTLQSPLSPYLRDISRISTGLRSISNCSALKELRSRNNHIAYAIVIKQMAWFRKVVSSIFFYFCLDSFF